MSSSQNFIRLITSMSLYILLSFSSSVAARSSSSFSSLDLNYRTAPFRKISPTGTLPLRNTSCIVKYSTSNYQDYFLLHAHIPKTGGTTIYRCITKFWDVRHKYGIVQGVTSKSKICDCRNVSVEKLNTMNYLSCEINGNGDLPYITSALNGKNIIPFTMIRHPLDYIYSAFGHHASRSRGKGACQNFNAIIAADRNPNSPAACIHYDIRNLQTRSLSSSDPQSFEPHTLGPANLTQALSVLRNEMFFVGITRYFRASMCLFAYQMGQLHLHTSVCDCRQLDPANEILGHSQPASIRQIMSPEAMGILRSSYINLDEILYSFAMDLFLTRIGIVEREAKMVLLCAELDGEDIMARKLILESQQS
jgi:hypothetical protein